jgi:site-specific recombinase XerD
MAQSKRTTTAYARAWERFEAWARDQGVAPLPASPAFVATYIAHLDAEGLKPSSIDVALAAIADRHDAAGVLSPRSAPEVKAVRSGLRRLRGTAPEQKAAITPAQLRSMVRDLPEGLRGKRDRALLLVGFASGMRRSELVALDVGDMRFVDGGLEVTIRRSKTDQEGVSRIVAVHRGSFEETCPVRALRAWLEASAITQGPLWQGFTGKGSAGLSGVRLHDRDVARVVQRAAAAAGMDPRTVAGHSLRAGFATAAASVGAQVHEIAEVTGHKTDGMVRRYIRQGRRFAKNPLAGAL